MTTPRFPRFAGSVFIKCLAMIAFSTTIVAGVLTFLSLRNAEETVKSIFAGFGLEVTDLVANQSGGAIQFRKPEDLEKLLGGAMDGLSEKAAGGIVVHVTGDVLYARTADEAATAGMKSLALRAIEAGAPVADASSLTFASPARFGSGDAVVGAVVMALSTAVAEARIADQRNTALMVGSGILATVLVVMGFVLRGMIAVPVRNVVQTMRAVADGDLDTEIRKTRRADEVGVLTRTLEDLVEKLRAARDATADAVLRGGGFEGSSAALVMADTDGVITHLNSAGEAVLRHMAGPEPKEQDLRGTLISDLHPSAIAVCNAVMRASGEEQKIDLEADGIHISADIGPILDGEGALVGYVIELQDVTESRLNGAVLASLDKNQTKAEFDAVGQLIVANDKFRIALNGADLDGATLRDLITTQEAIAAYSSGSAWFGDIEISVSGSAAVIHGGLSPAFDGSGALMRTVLIGTDVTSERQTVEAAEAQRARLEAAQAQMIAALRDGLRQLSAGDLTATIDAPFDGDNDQLRVDFNGALSHLSEAIGTVTSRAGTIRSEVRDISNAADDLSRRTEHQAATLEETAAALAEITASVSSAADGARKANEVVSEARSNAEASGGVVQDAVAAMGQIAESSAQISNIISVIDDIAFQTNLLALNAGVEAARAGDAGRGFAVVASEVRALAQRSSDAAREINVLISASGEHVERGVTLVGNAGEALKRIVSSVGGISGHVADIAASAQEQSAGLAQINTAMSQLDQVTQQNAAMFEETTAASRTLAEAAEDLSERVAVFSIEEVHHTTPTRAAGRSPDTITQERDHAFETRERTKLEAPTESLKATGTDSLSPYSEDDLDDDWTDF